jgi:hypothetical protein
LKLLLIILLALICGIIVWQLTVLPGRCPFNQPLPKPGIVCEVQHGIS